MKKGFIYLLFSKKFDKYYLGSTDNPGRRILYHNDGYSKSTKNYIPWKCLLLINVGDLQEARRIEYYIKQQKEKLLVANIVRAINSYYKTQ